MDNLEFAVLKTKKNKLKKNPQALTLGLFAQSQGGCFILICINLLVIS